MYVRSMMRMYLAGVLKVHLKCSDKWLHVVLMTVHRGLNLVATDGKCIFSKMD